MVSQVKYRGRTTDISQRIPKYKLVVTFTNKFGSNETCTFETRFTVKFSSSTN